MSGEAADADQLRAAVGAHLATLRGSETAHPFVDLSLVEALHRRTGVILDRWPTWSDAERVAVREVLAYLIDSDDEEHDLRSPIGLVDDEERLAVLERRLGLV
jgi:hypothetical protein